MVDIIGYEGLYAITSCGKVWSYKYKKFLKPGRCNDKNPYQKVYLYDNYKRKICYVHQLVAQAYLENPYGYKEVNHKDENKLNNCVSNLEWCSRLYNNTYGHRLEKTKITKSKRRLNNA
jgi:hypothetical protein